MPVVHLASHIHIHHHKFQVIVLKQRKSNFMSKHQHVISKLCQQLPGLAACPCNSFVGSSCHTHCLVCTPTITACCSQLNCLPAGRPDHAQHSSSDHKHEHRCCHYDKPNDSVLHTRGSVVWPQLQQHTGQGVARRDVMLHVLNTVVLKGCCGRCCMCHQEHQGQ